MKNLQIQLTSYGVVAVGLVVFIVVVGNYVGPEEELQGGLLKKLASEIQYSGAQLTREHVGFGC